MGKIGSRLSNAIVLMAAVLTAGTLGYHLIEGWSLFDSFYMTMITISTVGFREVERMSDGGRILTLALIIMGVSMVAYAGSGLMEPPPNSRNTVLLLTSRRDTTPPWAATAGLITVSSTFCTRCSISSVAS